MRYGLAPLLFLTSSCATLPTQMHNPTAAGFAGEIGPLYGMTVEDSAKVVSSEESKKVKTGEGTGVVSLLQFGNLYAKIDAAPLPGMWLGWSMTNPSPRGFGWYPGIELTGSSGSGEKEESRDGFLVDDSGNRYLYEIKRTRSGIGIAVPQLFELYPVKRLALFAGLIPTFLNEGTETTVEMVYENDHRIVLADSELDAKFADIQKYESRNDKNTNRWLMPIALGVRFQLSDFHLRAGYTTRMVDSLKDYETVFKDVVYLTVGYVATVTRRHVDDNRDHQKERERSRDRKRTPPASTVEPNPKERPAPSAPSPVPPSPSRR